MKKILLILTLLLSCVWGEEDSQWRGFFGVEGGAGVFATNVGFMLVGNTVFNSNSPLGLGYSVGVMGGLQKYTYEKVGIRHSFGFKFSYIPNVTSIRDKTLKEYCVVNCDKAKEYKFSNTHGNQSVLYYALDGLFDFVKTDKTRFGMILGISVDFAFTNGEGSDSVGGTTWLFGSARTGFYTQVNNNIFDLTLKLPVLGCGVGKPVFDTTLTLGYKYLF
ncbi:hypothetical protein [Helicobacter brantae]|uniref:hypothetical protein n=1 Tax=Helicobacter brantae TaxID=375927 RepID=UPI00147570E8|nr:hypothetical protein [Helicobacter brantae]